MSGQLAGKGEKPKSAWRPYRPSCPCCGNPLSLIVEKRGEELVIRIDCRWCGEYHGLTINTHLTDENLKLYSKRFLKKPRPWIVDIEQ